MPKWVVRVDGFAVLMHLDRKVLVVRRVALGCEQAAATVWPNWEAADRAAQSVRLLWPDWRVTVETMPDADPAAELCGTLSAAELARTAGPDAVPMGGAMRHAPGSVLGSPMDIQSIVASNAGGPA
jgi:hypothetical protein